MKYLDGYLAQITLTIFLALAAWLGVQAKKLYKKHITTEMQQKVCRTAVQFVEQVYQDIHGPEKLQKAMERASVLLAEHGIKITEYELVTMLEAAVAEFNHAFERNQQKIWQEEEEEKYRRMLNGVFAEPPEEMKE